MAAVEAAQKGAPNDEAVQRAKIELDKLYKQPIHDPAQTGRA